MKRRDFLMTSAMTMRAAATPWGWQTQRPAESKADRIAIMAYSFVRVLKLPGRPSSPEENKAAAIETLARMTGYARTRKIMVGAEPRGDDFTLLTEVIRAGGAYTNPDVGTSAATRRIGMPGSARCFPIPTATAT